MKSFRRLYDFGVRRFGVRRQSEAATALWILCLEENLKNQSGVALRLPPHSKGPNQ